MRKTVATLVIAASGLLATPVEANHRVIVGELQDFGEEGIDISPPTRLDVNMYPRRLNGLTPKERCDHWGGRIGRERLRINGKTSWHTVCYNVDY